MQPHLHHYKPPLQGHKFNSSSTQTQPTNQPSNQLSHHHMGKKMKLLPNFLSSTDPPRPPPSPSPSPAWQWPSCGNLKTVSFRATSSDDTIFRMANSAFDLSFTSSSSLADSSSMSEEDPPSAGGDAVESVIRGLRSDRLFFHPGESTSSILEIGKSKNINQIKNTKNIKNCCCDDDGDGDGDGDVPYKESTVAVSMDSKDPYADFRRSMEEMMEAHGLKDWAGLEELLSWYLKVNGKSNHGYIVGAFIDLLVGLSFAGFFGESSSSSASSSFTISHSSLPSSPLSLPSSLSIPTPCSSSHPLDQGDD